MIITFCGHSKIKLDNTEILCIKNFLLEKIKVYPYAKFYLGGYGNFDLLILRILRELKQDFPNIELVFISPYIDNNYTKLKNAKYEYDCSIFPPLENVPRKFAIIERNKWMVERSDFIVAYVKYSFGGARKTLDYAIKKKKEYINFAK